MMESPRRIGAIRSSLLDPPPRIVPATLKLSGIAYSNSKLAILYYAHELQRRARKGIIVVVFEPGLCQAPAFEGARPGIQRMGRAIARSPVSSARRSAPGGRWRRSSSTTAGRICATALRR